MDKPSIVPILRKIPLFAPMHDEDLATIANGITLRYFPKGYRIFAEGSVADMLYIMKAGQVRVIQGASDKAHEVGVLGEGDIFGEMSLISNDPHNATVETATDCEVFTLTREEFQKILSQNAEIASHISEKFMKRLRDNIREEKAGY